MFNTLLLRKCLHKTSFLFCNDRQIIIKGLLDNAATFQDIKPATAHDTWSTLPYVEGTIIRRDQSRKAYRPRMDPKDTSIIIFPGHGAEYIGMAKDLVKFPGARDIFELANDLLKFDLLKLCLSGPMDKLNNLENSQLAVFVTSLASLEKLKEERPNAIENCIATAGFSLGEITALVFAGSIPFNKALRLIQIRAETMKIASETISGAMATILYAPDTQLGLACKSAIEWCTDKGIENPCCDVSNYLYPHCKIIAGNTEALEYIEVNMRRFKIRRMKRLPTVNGAFHSKIMQGTVEPFAKALAKIKLQDPCISVHSNIDGKQYRDAQHILKKLPKQLISPVKWEQTLHILYERQQGEHFPRTFECGPGNGLRHILKLVNAKAWDTSYNII